MPSITIPDSMTHTVSFTNSRLRDSMRIPSKMPSLVLGLESVSCSLACSHTLSTLRQFNTFRTQARTW